MRKLEFHKWTRIVFLKRMTYCVKLLKIEMKIRGNL